MSEFNKLYEELISEKTDLNVNQVLIELGEMPSMKKYDTGGTYDSVQYEMPLKAFLKAFKLKSEKDLQDINDNTKPYEGDIHMDYDGKGLVQIHGGS